MSSPEDKIIEVATFRAGEPSEPEGKSPDEGPEPSSDPDLDQGPVSMAPEAGTAERAAAGDSTSDTLPAPAGPERGADS